MDVEEVVFVEMHAIIAKVEVIIPLCAKTVSLHILGMIWMNRSILPWHYAESIKETLYH